MWPVVGTFYEMKHLCTVVMILVCHLLPVPLILIWPMVAALAYLLHVCNARPQHISYLISQSQIITSISSVSATYLSHCQLHCSHFSNSSSPPSKCYGSTVPWQPSNWLPRNTVDRHTLNSTVVTCDGCACISSWNYSELSLPELACKWYKVLTIAVYGRCKTETHRYWSIYSKVWHGWWDVVTRCKRMKSVQSFHWNWLFYCG